MAARPGLLAVSRGTSAGRHVHGHGRSQGFWYPVRAVFALVVVLTLGVQYLRYTFRVLSVDGGSDVSVDAVDALPISGGGNRGGAFKMSPIGNQRESEELESQSAGEGEVGTEASSGSGEVAGVPAIVMTARATADGSGTSTGAGGAGTGTGGGGGDIILDRGSGEEEEEEEATGDVEEEGGVREGGEDSAKPKCKCNNGVHENCHSLTPGHEPNPRELVIAAVCGIAYEMSRVRRNQRVREEAHSSSVGVSRGSGDVRGGGVDPQLQVQQKKQEAVRKEKPWFVRKDASDVMRIRGGNGDKWLQEYFTAEERGHAIEVNALEMRAAAAIMRAVPHLVRPVGRDLTPENIFYSAQNHEKLRDKKDPFRNDSLLLLPRTSPMLRYPTCAVVGSSGVMTSSGLGRQIDAHDAVVRLNQAPCQVRYQPDVGERTTLRILNKRWTAIYGRHHPELMHVDPDAKKNENGGGGGMTVIASRCNVAEYKKLGQSAARLDPPVPTLFLATRIASHAGELLSVFRRGMMEAMGRKYRGGTSPSSGFLAVFIMLQMCGVDGGARSEGAGIDADGAWRATKVGVYGFSADECRKAGCVNSYHYFNGFIDSPWLRAHPSHSFELEGIALQALSAVGEICYVTNNTGTCAGREAGGNPLSRET